MDNSIAAQPNGSVCWFVDVPQKAQWTANNVKKTTLALVICIIFFLALCLQAVNIVKGYPLGEIPLKVNAPETYVNAAISQVDGVFWADIGAEYKDLFPETLDAGNSC